MTKRIVLKMLAIFDVADDANPQQVVENFWTAQDTIGPWEFCYGEDMREHITSVTFEPEEDGAYCDGQPITGEDE